MNLADSSTALKDGCSQLNGTTSFRSEAKHSLGLDIVTKAIYYSETRFADPKLLAKFVKERKGIIIDFEAITARQSNVYLASIARDICHESGWIAGWICLSEAAPSSGLHKQLMKDTASCAEIYSNLRVTDKREPRVDIRMEVTSSPNTDSL
jgi:hypothetical protein